MIGLAGDIDEASAARVVTRLTERLPATSDRKASLDVPAGPPPGYDGRYRSWRTRESASVTCRAVSLTIEITSG